MKSLATVHVLCRRWLWKSPELIMMRLGASSESDGEPSTGMQISMQVCQVIMN